VHLTPWNALRGLRRLEGSSVWRRNGSLPRRPAAQLAGVSRAAPAVPSYEEFMPVLGIAALEGSPQSHRKRLVAVVRVLGHIRAIEVIVVVVAVSAVAVAGVSNREHWGLLELQPHPLWIVVLAIAVLYGSPAGYLAGILTAGTYLGLLWLRPGGNSLSATEVIQPILFVLAGALIGEATSAMRRRRADAEHRYEQVFQLWRTFYERYMTTVQAKAELERRVVGLRRSMSTLRESAQKFQTLTEGEVYPGILEALTALMDVRTAAVYMAKDGILRLEVGLPPDVPGRPKELSLDSAGAVRGGDCWSADAVATANPPEAGTAATNGTASLSCWLRGSEGRVLGLVVLEDLPDTLDPFAALYLEQVATSASLALQNPTVQGRIANTTAGGRLWKGDGGDHHHEMAQEMEKRPGTLGGEKNGSVPGDARNELKSGGTTSLRHPRPGTMISVARPQTGKEEQLAVLNVMASGQLAQGERVAMFEREFAQLCLVGHAVATSSGTAALHMALLAHGIGPGDEVITTPFSFAATANVIRMVGATPVFVDIEQDTYNLDPTLVEAAVSPRTRAVMPVHLYGNPCDMHKIAAIAERHQLAIIEDACQAHLASVGSRPVGGFGTGCFSFYATKNMTMGEGGIVTTDDSSIANRIRLLRNHGQSDRYHHVTLGYNLRLTEMQAAIGLAQIEKLPWLTERRVANAAFLTERLRERLQTPVARPGNRHVYHQYTIRVPEERDAWAQVLHERGIGTAIHYPCPIHLQPAYRHHGYRESLPVAEAAAREVLSLPVHPGLTSQELNTIIDEVLALCP
jgi:perosamine synthetase